MRAASWDPMDALLLEQHLRSPLRLFPDPLMAQFASGGPGPDLQDPASVALLEKARQQLQMWGRSPYSDLLLPQMYHHQQQRPPSLPGLNPLMSGLWQAAPAGTGWPPTGPQMPHGFLPNSATAAAMAAAAASVPPPPPRTTPPPTSTASSAGSPSPDSRTKHFTRFTPYQVPPAATAAGWTFGSRLTSKSLQLKRSDGRILRQYYKDGTVRAQMKEHCR
uniref:Uncharacterized protein n=1 Tax=Anopheles albimanus TaxID=7167 RepID=A0A182F1T5_ANOAL